jgi:hypothetical protein
MCNLDSTEKIFGVHERLLKEAACFPPTHPKLGNLGELLVNITD